MTNAMGRWTRKDRRSGKGPRPEHDFSITAIGLMVVGVVLAVMFSV